MILLIRSAAVLALVCLASCATVPSSVQVAAAHVPDSYAEAAANMPVAVALPLALQLPREGPAPAPFYPPQPPTYLDAPPRQDGALNYYQQVPTPAQDLVAPVDTVWNPNNDPKFYYELPASLTKEELPTGDFPKKFNKDIHTKEKPFSPKPKQEIELHPINEEQYLTKHKELQKTFQKLAKKENQKQIQSEKEKPSV